MARQAGRKAMAAADKLGTIETTGGCLPAMQKMA